MLVAHLYRTLCHLMNCSPPGSSVHGFSRQEYWSGLPGSPPGDLPNPGIEPRSPTLQADSLSTELFGKPILRGVRGKCPSLAVTSTVVEVGSYLTYSHSPHGRSHGLIPCHCPVQRSVLSLSCASWGKGLTQVKWNYSFHPLQCVKSWILFCLSVCFFVSAFAPAVCWNLSAGIPGFCSALLVLWWLSTLVLFEQKVVENLHFAMLMISLSSFNLHYSTVK